MWRLEEELFLFGVLCHSLVGSSERQKLWVALFTIYFPERSDRFWSKAYDWLDDLSIKLIWTMFFHVALQMTILPLEKVSGMNPIFLWKWSGVVATPPSPHRCDTLGWRCKNRPRGRVTAVQLSDSVRSSLFFLHILILWQFYQNESKSLKTSCWQSF